MIDIDKIQNKRIGKIYKPLYVNKYTTIKQQLSIHQIKPDAELIVFKVDTKYVAFSKKLMAFHHIAEGYINEKPYMLTFCVICNSGMILNPVVNQNMLHFYVAGVYNGMLLMADKETGSYWDHITGTGLSGLHENTQLEILQSHQILTVKEVLKQYPSCLYGEAKMNFFQKLFSKFQNWKANTNGNGFLPPGFRKSMSEIDDRLPEMEMGLGVWDQHKSKFYTTKLIRQNGNFLFDKLNNKSLIVYIASETAIPAALYMDQIEGLIYHEKKIVFPNGNYIQSGNLFSPNDEMLDFNQPHTMFSRWYGFVSTFPDCEVKTYSQPISE